MLRLFKQRLPTRTQPVLDVHGSV